MMNLPTFKATCVNHHTFAVPQLPDMSYGTFLYFSTDGQSVRHYSGIDDPVWECIETVIEKKWNDLKGNIIPPIIGRLADDPEKDVHFTIDISCPTCQAKVQTIDVTERVESLEVQPLSFHHFKSLINFQKETMIISIVDRIQAL